MEHAISLFVRSIFADNMIFAYFLGMCSYLAVSKNVKTSAGLGVAVTFVLVVTLPVNYLLQTLVLEPLHLEYLSFILFIAVIAAIVQLVEMIVEKYIMGGSLFMQQRIGLPAVDAKAITSLLDAFMYAFGSGLGWFLAIVCLAGIREKMEYNDVPKPLQGFLIGGTQYEYNSYYLCSCSILSSNTPVSGYPAHRQTIPRFVR